MHEFIVTQEPVSVVTAQEAKDAGVFSADDSDASVQASLDAAQAMIDGPTGWLGRCIGEQEICMTVDVVYCDEIELFFPPIIEITEVAHVATDGTETIQDESGYWVKQPNSTRPKLMFSGSAPVVDRGETIRITYTAGYAEVPYRIKQAIMLMARNLLTAVPVSGVVGALRSETIEGVGRWDYTAMSGEQATEYIGSQACALLGGYRIAHL